jgi:nicotinamide-nucleotide amidase
MALHVCHFFSADYGIGITGYASPVPEQNIKKLFAFIAIAKNNRLVLSKKIYAEISEPREVQLFYTQHVIKMLISILNK